MEQEEFNIEENNQTKLLNNIINIQRKNISDIAKLGILNRKDILRCLKYSNLEQLFQENNCDFNNIKNICWIWNGRTMKHNNNDKGHQHGALKYKNKYTAVHRLFYHNFIGDVPEFKMDKNALWVLHKCSHEQNGACFNPIHLYLGTPKDNVDDQKREGTVCMNKKSGEANNKSKLTDVQILEIIKLKKDNPNMMYKEIAEKYNVHPTQISRYINGKTRVNFIKE